MHPPNLNQPETLVQIFSGVTREPCTCGDSFRMRNKKDGYRQRNVRQFLQSAWSIFWPHLATPLGQSW